MTSLSPPGPFRNPARSASSSLMSSESKVLWSLEPASGQDHLQSAEFIVNALQRGLVDRIPVFSMKWELAG